MASVLPEFELQRKNIQQKGVAAEQQTREAVQRRLAAMGGLKTGAGVKLQEQAVGGVREQVGQELGQLGIAEASALRQQQEVQRQRDFEAEQAKIGREQQQAQFTSQLGEQVASRQQQRDQFTSQLGEQAASRQQQQSQFNVQQDFSNRQFDFQSKLQSQQLDLQRRGVDLEEQAQSFNKFMSVFSIADHGRMTSALQFLEKDPNMPQNMKDLISTGFLNPIRDSYKKRAELAAMSIDNKPDDQLTPNQLSDRYANYSNERLNALGYYRRAGQITRG